MKTKHNPFLAALAVFAAITHDSAARLFWDANGANTGTGGTGTWTNDNTWRVGSSTGTLGNWANDNNAVFPSSSGTVTLGSSVSVSRLTFNANNYTIGQNANSTDTISFSGSYGSGNPAIAGTAVAVNMASKITGTIDGGLMINIGEASATALDRISFTNTNNDFTGDIVLLGGKLNISNANSTFGDAANKVIVNGGGFQYSVGLNVNTTFSRAVEIGASGGNLAISVSTGSGSSSITFSGAITGSGTWNHVRGTGSGIGSGTANVFLTGDMSGFTGTVDVKTSTTHIQTSTQSAGAWSVSTGGTLRLNNTTSDTHIANGTGAADLTMAGGTLDMNGESETLNGLSGASGIVRNNASDSTSTLTLGDDDATASFGGTLIDGNGTLALTKIGAGTQTLTGANNYSGGTIVEEGTLVLTGTAGGETTVKSGAALTPGGGSATLNTNGPVTFEPGANFAAQIDSSAATAGQIFANNEVTLTGAILSLTDIAGTPAAIPVGTKLVLIDYDTMPLTSTFSGLPEGSTVSTGINNFTLSYADDGFVTLTAQAGSDPYAAWAAGAGLDGSPGKEAGFDDDPDGDGIANGLEWILGGNPLDGKSATLVTTTAANGLTISFTREANSIGQATLAVEYNTDLGAVWQSSIIGATNSGPDANGVTVTIDTDASPHQVTVNIPASNAPDGKLFSRLKARTTL